MRGSQRSEACAPARLMNYVRAQQYWTGALDVSAAKSTGYVPLIEFGSRASFLVRLSSAFENKGKMTGRRR